MSESSLEEQVFKQACSDCNVHLVKKFLDRNTIDITQHPQIFLDRVCGIDYSFEQSTEEYEKRRVQIIDLLIEKGLDLNTCLNGPNSCIFNTLRIVIERDQASLLKCFMERGFKADQETLARAVSADALEITRYFIGECNFSIESERLYYYVDTDGEPLKTVKFLLKTYLARYGVEACLTSEIPEVRAYALAVHNCEEQEEEPSEKVKQQKTVKIRESFIWFICMCCCCLIFLCERNARTFGWWFATVAFAFLWFKTVIKVEKKE